MPTTRVRLGDALIARKVLTQEQLEVALGEQRRAHRPLGEILVGLGFVRREDIARVVAEGLELPFIQARDVQPDPVLVAALDPEFARSAGAFPIALVDGSLQVAMVDPGQPDQVSLLRQRFPYPLSLLVTTPEDLAVLIRKYLQTPESLVTRILKGSIGEGAVGEGTVGEISAERLCEALLVDGVRMGSTDIHLEPEETVTRIRFRVDGILRPGENLPRSTTDAVVSRIKILSELDIAERRQPQDGRLRLQVDGRRVDMRVSVMPCAHGENVVLRVLDRSAGVIELGDLGICMRTQRPLERIAERPYGLFLVTGPTGSGKTTTLYSLLNVVDSIHRNVATIEDPIESRLPLIRQSQVDPAVGFDFESGLRALLRQDPDVILVGEIRDRETVDMALKASMTGHLVFSTLHTNTAVGAVARLLDLGVAPYLVEDAMIGVLGQRLVRKVCEGCVEAYEPDQKELAWLDGTPGMPRKGAGCDLCGGTGYSGRTVLSELFLPDDKTAEAMGRGAGHSELATLAVANGFLPLAEDGKDKVRHGITTIDEVERVSRNHRLSLGELEDL